MLVGAVCWKYISSVFYLYIQRVASILPTHLIYTSGKADAHFFKFVSIFAKFGCFRIKTRCVFSINPSLLFAFINMICIFVPTKIMLFSFTNKQSGIKFLIRRKTV